MHVNDHKVQDMGVRKWIYFIYHSCHCWNYGFTRLLTTALCWFVCMYDC